MKKLIQLLSSKRSDKSEVLHSELELIWFIALPFCFFVFFVGLTCCCRRYHNSRIRQAQNMYDQFLSYPQAQFPTVPSQPYSQQYVGYKPQQGYKPASSSDDSLHFAAVQPTGNILGINDPDYNHPTLPDQPALPDPPTLQDISNDY